MILDSPDGKCTGAPDTFSEAFVILTFTRSSDAEGGSTVASCVKGAVVVPCSGNCRKITCIEMQGCNINSLVLFS